MQNNFPKFIFKQLQLHDSEIYYSFSSTRTLSDIYMKI